MSIYLKAKKLDLSTGALQVAVVHSRDAHEHGLTADTVITLGAKDTSFYVMIDITDTLVEPGEIGLYRDIWERYKVNNGDMVALIMKHRNRVHEIIRKKVLGQSLSAGEIDKLITALTQHSVKDVMLAYFLATFFSPGYDENESLAMVKSIVAHGHPIDFTQGDARNASPKYIIDKHSIGGLPSKGVTPILVSILANFENVVIPNTSTRAITSAAGTSDVLETVMNVDIPEEQLIKQIHDIGVFMAWGGGLDLTPAVYEMIRLEHGLHIESFKKVIISIVATKKAMGLTHVLIDLPFGPSTKVHHTEDAEQIAACFKKLFKGVGIEAVVHRRRAIAPDGFGIGPMLEMRDILYVLEQDSRRPEHLQHQAVEMAGKLLDLTGITEKGWGYQEAKRMLRNGQALEKFWEIATTQGATKQLRADELELGKFQRVLTVADLKLSSAKLGTIKTMDNKGLIHIAKLLGSPQDKSAGLYLHKYIGDKLDVDDQLLTLYTSDQNRLDLAMHSEVLHGLFLLE